MNSETIRYSIGALLGAMLGGALLAIKVLVISTITVAAFVIVGFISAGTAKAIVVWCVALAILVGFVAGLLNAYLLAQAHKWTFQD
jgi:hypothetical protein